MNACMKIAIGWKKDRQKERKTNSQGNWGLTDSWSWNRIGIKWSWMNREGRHSKKRIPGSRRSMQICILKPAPYLKEDRTFATSGFSSEGDLNFCICLIAKQEGTIEGRKEEWNDTWSATSGQSQPPGLNARPDNKTESGSRRKVSAGSQHYIWQWPECSSRSRQLRAEWS